ncbi:hypothetical protein GJR96_00725 [Haloferax sp. MBLA0076]|uniref:Uncharacterized protein n=1 Tax=Haloferax litoreum TaxID=2666140 RepID=A0A6A8GB94_9EURY|nr:MULTISPECIES: hypothetical protein [Haloferax]KAB1192041.1 hypothetical protein Hfx1148_00730 [Haloferax sp. CBA1148]MRX20483.1 hypothetical protein [Haloferax litoreum]
MPSPGTLRDSTQIVLPYDLLDDVREEIESEFVVSIHENTPETCRIIGSPVEIRKVGDYLARQGISLP